MDGRFEMVEALADARADLNARHVRFGTRISFRERNFCHHDLSEIKYDCIFCAKCFLIYICYSGPEGMYQFF